MWYVVCLERRIDATTLQHYEVNMDPEAESIVNMHSQLKLLPEAEQL